MAVGSLSAQLNKNKYPQTKVYRGDSVVILSIDQSNFINKTFKEQKEALDSFKVVTDTLTRYRDSVIVKYVKTDSILTITDSLRRELLAYKNKVEEAARLGLYVTYDTIRQQAKFLPFDKDFKVQMKETESGVKLFATSYDQFTKTRIGIGCGLSLLGGLSKGVANEIYFHPGEVYNTFPNMSTAFWYLGEKGSGPPTPALVGQPTSWRRETRVGNIVFKSDLYHISNATFLTSSFIGMSVSLYETTTWRQVIYRSLLNSAFYMVGYNTTKAIIK